MSTFFLIAFASGKIQFGDLYEPKPVILEVVLVSVFLGLLWPLTHFFCYMIVFLVLTMSAVYATNTVHPNPKDCSNSWITAGLKNFPRCCNRVQHPVVKKS